MTNDCAITSFESALDQNAELRTAFSLINDALFWIDDRGSVVSVNPRAEKLLGGLIHESEKPVIWNLNPFRLRSSCEEEAKKARQYGAAANFTIENDEELYDCTIAPMQRGLLVSLRDRSGERQSSRRIKACEEFNVRMLQSSCDCIKVLELDGRISLLNEASQHLLEICDRRMLIGFNWLDFWDRPNDRNAAEQALEEARRGRIGRFTGTAHLRNGRVKRWDEIVTPILGSDHQPEKILIIARDITEQVEAEEQLKRAKDAAEVANSLKSAFLANMSHEIRTPLGAILGFAELLNDRGLSEKDRATYIDVINRNGEQLASLINDILDLSKVESGHFKTVKARFNPRELVEDVISLLSVKARQKSLSLKLEIEEGFPTVAVSDPVRLRQILMNIIGNAVKFTDQGSVLLQCGRRGQKLKFIVEDTGIGIAPDKVSELFKPFSQADVSSTRTYGGTGLGLVLARRMARLLGGDLQLEHSEKGRGSCFEITVENDCREAVNVEEAEVSSAAHQALDVMSNLSLEGYSVLIVDDAPDNQQLIARILKRAGARVEIATNGGEAVFRAMHEAFDIVLMDIQMPVLDGYSATQVLRDSGFRRPIIALTAHAMQEVRDKCLRCGFDNYLTKPIRRTDLLDLVSRTLHDGHRDQPHDAGDFH